MTQLELTSTDAYYNRYWSNEGLASRGQLSQFLEGLLERHIPPGASCLDVGCGDGRGAGLWLTQHGRRHVGVDISANAVRDAQSLGLDARKIDTAEVLPFQTAEFDAAVCFEVFEHLFQPQLAAAEIHRVLRPGSPLVATVPNVAYWRRRIDLLLAGRWHPLGDDLSVEQPWRDPHIRFFNPGALRRMLVGAGFRDVHVGGHQGMFLGDLPILSRLPRSRERAASPIYRAFERLIPSLLGFSLYAVAWR